MLMSVQERVVENAARLLKEPRVSALISNQEPVSGDLLVINNSFVFREVKTNKSALYLALKFGADTAAYEPIIVSGFQQNSDLRYVAAKSKNYPTCEDLAHSLDGQIDQLGHLMFLLGGNIQDDDTIECDVKHATYSVLVWRPAALEAAYLDNDRIVVRDTDDEGLIWETLCECFSRRGSDVPSELREPLGMALDRLQEKATARIVIPAPGAPVADGISDAILAVIKEQRDEYEACLHQYRADPDVAADALNNVFRIAYNFASDAATFIRLIVSICDLKPIVLWMTIYEHYQLSQAFERLPWSRSTSKASLKNYHQCIADARNSAFHNLFPFRKSLRVSLPEAALGAPELQIFSEHSKKSSNQLLYTDKELVDVLVEFTRARQRRLPFAFWVKNLDVMDATIALIGKTSEAIKILTEFRKI
jgi:hypothetical protein